MEYALNNSTKMRIQEADRDDEQLARRESILKAFTPSVDAGAYAYNNYGRTKWFVFTLILIYFKVNKPCAILGGYRLPK